MNDMIRAPWTPEQVAALNAFQDHGGMHPFTCGNDHATPALHLVAHEDGWHCWLPDCDFRQDWAHAFMADPDAWPKPVPRGRSDVGTEFVQQVDHLDGDALNEVEAELTAEEARALADDLGLQLYRAQDALAFVEECCVIAERSGRTITVADVRTWLKGAQCGRQLAADGELAVDPAAPPVHLVTWTGPANNGEQRPRTTANNPATSRDSGPSVADCRRLPPRRPAMGPATGGRVMAGWTPPPRDRRAWQSPYGPARRRR